MQRTLKKFRVLFFSIFAAILISALLLCIFKFNAFADNKPDAFKVYTSGAVEDHSNFKPEDYPVMHYDGNDHKCYVYTYEWIGDFLDKLQGNDNRGVLAKIYYNGDSDKPWKDWPKVFGVYQFSMYTYPAANISFKDPGFYKFKVDMCRTKDGDPDKTDWGGDFTMPTKYYRLCISDVSADSVSTEYSGAYSSIIVHPGNYAETEQLSVSPDDPTKVDTQVGYSTVDPRNVDNPETDITWYANNFEYNNVGSYIVYYRVKVKMPFYDVGGKGNDIERIFYGSATVKINPKKSQYEYRKSIFEGATGINAPQENKTYHTYDFDNVYLGSFANGSYSSGIKFKLLSTSANDDFYKGGYLLMSYNVLGKTSLDGSSAVDKMFYTNDSLLSQYMNGHENNGTYDDVYHNAFTDLEKSTILKINSKTDEDKILEGTPGTTERVTRALGSYFKGNESSYMFPLSAVEAHNENYGFSNYYGGDSGRGFLNKDIADNWWCRSTYRWEYYQLSGTMKGWASNTAFESGAIDSNGGFSGFNHKSSQGIRPALNFDSSKVILTSRAGIPENEIKGAKALPTTEKFIKTDEQQQCSDFKFTLKDNSLGFNINENESFEDSTGKREWNGEHGVKENGLVATTENRVIKIPYKGVTTGIDSTYISALIVHAGKDKTDDQSGSVAYYGRPEAVSKTDGYLEITLPLDLEKGKYTLKLFEEKYNGGNYDNTNLTDYGSTPVEVKLTMLQTLDYYHSFELNQHVFYDGNLHGFGPDREFRIEPCDPNNPNEEDKDNKVKITYADVTENPDDPNPDFKDTAIQVKDPYIVDGKVKPYVFKFKLSIDPKKEDPTYYAEKIETVYLTIEKQPIRYAAPKEYDVLYDGTDKSIDESIRVEQPSLYKIQYSENEAGPYSDTSLQYKDAGDHIVYFKITDPNKRYADTVGCVDLCIKKCPIQYYSTSVETVYDAGEHVIEVNTNNNLPPKDLATIKYSKTGDPGSYTLDTCPSYVDAGDYTIYFEITAGDNYEPVYGQTKLKIDKATIFYTVGDLQADYNGGYHQIDIRYNNVQDSAKPKVTYYKDAAHTEIYEGAPYFKDATDGKQNVYFHIDAGPVAGKPNEYNYEPVDGVTTVDIRPATIQYKVEDISTLTYDGDKHGAVISTTNVDDSASTITYSEDGVNYGLVNPRYTDAGTYTVYYKINANNFKEAKGQVTFTIQQRPMSYVYIEDIPGRIFNGAPITPSVIVHDGDPSIVRDDDYDVSYTDNTAPGMGIVTLTGKHNYIGTTTKHFMIYSDSDTNGASEAYTFDTSGSSLLGLPSFGTSHKSNSSNVGAPTDANNQDIDQAPADNNGANQDNKINDPNSNNTPKPKSFRDYIYIIIGGSILLLSILAVLILKIRSHRVKAKPIDVENIEVPEPTNDAK